MEIDIVEVLFLEVRALELKAQGYIREARSLFSKALAILEKIPKKYRDKRYKEIYVRIRNRLNDER